MKKHTIITLKNEGHSNREVSKLTGISRKTVAHYWNNHKEQLLRLDTTDDTRGIQELITEKPRYDTSNRGPIKYTPAIDDKTR